MTTGMTGIGCTVYANGLRVADGSPSDDPLDPNVLSGLSVTWGRSTTVDQPEPSTCTFQLVDPLGGQAFLEMLAVGTPVDVEASGDTVVTTNVANVDPSFESVDPTLRSWSVGSGVVGWASDYAFDGARSLRVRRPTTSGAGTTTYIAPDVLEPSGGNPAAWDQWVQPHPGETWRYRLRVRSRRDAAHPITLRASLEAMPSPWLPSAGPVGTAQTFTTANDWTLSEWATTFDATLPAGWLAMHVDGVTYAMPWSSMTVGQAWQVVGDGSWSWENIDDVWLDVVEMLAPVRTTVGRTVRVFSGRVTAVSLTWPDADESPIVEVTAHDFLADLANRDVGDDPWPQEDLGTRVDRILTLAGGDVEARIDPDVAARQVTWRDVDRQPATGLVQELAASADAVTWSATHMVTGPYIEIEDPSNRPSFYRLQVDADGLVEIVTTPYAIEAVEVNACTVLRDPVQWLQDVQDLVTISSVSWQEQTVDDEGLPAPTERTVTVQDDAGIASYGSRRVSLSSQLALENDALDVATRILARLSSLEWRASGITVDDGWQLDDADVALLADALFRLLDGTTRNGAPVRLTELPGWSPAGDTAVVYLEGGAYAFEGGAWVLDLIVSSATAAGHSATWSELTVGWSWAMFAPGVRWEDLTGVSV